MELGLRKRGGGNITYRFVPHRTTDSHRRWSVQHLEFCTPTRGGREIQQEYRGDTLHSDDFCRQHPRKLFIIISLWCASLYWQVVMYQGKQAGSGVHAHSLLARWPPNENVFFLLFIEHNLLFAFTRLVNTKYCRIKANGLQKTTRQVNIKYSLCVVYAHNNISLYIKCYWPPHTTIIYFSFYIYFCNYISKIFCTNKMSRKKGDKSTTVKKIAVMCDIFYHCCHFCFLSKK